MPEKKYFKICPKCGSTNITTEFNNAAKISYGAPLDYTCDDCGFSSKVFLEITEEEITNFRESIKKE
jgi:predicted RNA-binding Zn-ribbon protein involved in translation (DUF1610 family)